jgi:hypothetical protein
MPKALFPVAEMGISTLGRRSRMLVITLKPCGIRLQAFFAVDVADINIDVATPQGLGKALANFPTLAPHRVMPESLV